MELYTRIVELGGDGDDDDEEEERLLMIWEWGKRIEGEPCPPDRQASSFFLCWAGDSSAVSDKNGS